MMTDAPLAPTSVPAAPHTYTRFTYTAMASTMVPLTLAVLGMTAWGTGRLVLASFHRAYIPMAPSTALAFAFVSAALIAQARGGQAMTREAIRAIALLLSVLAIIKIAEFVTGITILNAEAAIVARPGQFGGVPLARMSPLTAAALLLIGLALACLTIPSAPRVRDVAGILGATVVLVGSTVILGYLYGAPLLYGGRVIPVALPTGLALLTSGVALVALTGPTGLPLRPLFGDAVRASVAERLHRELMDRSAYVIEAAGAGIWEVDLRTGATRWSEVLAPMFGLPAEARETTREDFHDRIHPEDRPGVDAALTRLIERDAPYDVLFRACWPDGRVRWLSSKGRVIRNATGDPIAILGMSIDVTERKDLEQRLEHAEKMESLGRLAGAIAHDFNNVLTAILGFSEMLLIDSDPADRRGTDVTEIRQAAESGKLLVRQLLAFSRQQPLEPVLLDLNAVVVTSAGMLQQLLGREVTLDTHLTPSLGRIWADPGQMQQVLVNLAVNARGAMPQGGRFVIETFARRQNDRDVGLVEGEDDSHVALRISDTGMGMTEETKARIFEPFFTTKTPDKGTGLGLSTVYGIVRQSGGSIDVSSTAGVGTSFTIYFRTENSTTLLATTSENPHALDAS